MGSDPPVSLTQCSAVWMEGLAVHSVSFTSVTVLFLMSFFS